jgi:outer membrane lipoprotein-sorting protein
MRFNAIGRVLPAIALVCAMSCLSPSSGAEAAPTMALAQIVEQMQQHAQAQKDRLKQWKSLRHYHVEYRGFSRKLDATMNVEVNYVSGKGKIFHILSESGSKILFERVLKRAVESEKEAAQDADASALTTANYRFELAGNDVVAARPAYVLNVEPITANKFLYRGKIWVDAKDFAVVKMETEPAKNPSFWISRTLIHLTAVDADGFWLPHQMRSETKVRIGGAAVLTIDYGDYDVSGSS